MARKEVFTMVVRVYDDGSVDLTGPLDNQILCLGLLEAAKKKVLDHNEQKERPNKAVAPLDLSIDTLTLARKAFDMVSAPGKQP